MPVTTVLFDLDGTLVDSLPLIKRTYQKVFQEMQLSINEDDPMKWTGRPLHEIGRYFVGQARESRFYELYQHYYGLEHDRYTKVYPETRETLERLHRSGFKLGIVTSKSRAGALRATSFLGLDRYMAVTVTATDVLTHKPQPEPVLKAMELLGVEPAETIYIGDSPFDITAGRLAGVKTYGVTWGMASREELLACEPTDIMESWTDLFKYLAG